MLIQELSAFHWRSDALKNNNKNLFISFTIKYRGSVYELQRTTKEQSQIMQYLKIAWFKNKEKKTIIIFSLQQNYNKKGSFEPLIFTTNNAISVTITVNV